MAESTAVRLLMADAATLAAPSATRHHQHPFWQLDLCPGGGFALRLADGRHAIARGQGVLIPPGVPHAFAYRRGSRYRSWKFAWGGRAPAGAVLLAGQPGWAGIAQALVAVEARPAIEALLAAAALLAVPAEACPAAGLVGLVEGLLARRPAQVWSVAAVAAALGLSPGHLSARFHAEQGVALKAWLDARRGERAGALLVWSDLSIAAIAARCGFADQFAFARFFRRVAGETASAFRARQASPIAHPGSHRAP